MRLKLNAVFLAVLSAMALATASFAQEPTKTNSADAKGRERTSGEDRYRTRAFKLGRNDAPRHVEPLDSNGFAH